MSILNFDKERKLMEIAGGLTQKEAIEMMLNDVEILDPISYIFFSNGVDVKDIMPHSRYCELMKKKAIDTNDRKLLKLVKKYEGALE